MEGEYAYKNLYSTALKHSWAGEIKNVSTLVAIGVDKVGHRSMLGICKGYKEKKTVWSDFLARLKKTGLNSVKLVISNVCIELVESNVGCYPEVDRLRCAVHFCRKVFLHVPSTQVKHAVNILQDYSCSGKSTGFTGNIPICQ